MDIANSDSNQHIQYPINVSNKDELNLDICIF